MGDKTRVIIVDDSASVRKVLSEIINSNPDMEVFAAVSDPIIAVRYFKKQWPDVIILDIEMPRKDGITFLKEIMDERPTPVIICSSLAEKNAQVTMEALSAGAVEIITKPKIGIKEFLNESVITITDAVRSASNANMSKVRTKPIKLFKIQPKLSADVILSPYKKKRDVGATDRIIAIGASAGGTQALEMVLHALPVQCPGIVIVQHMPEKFTAAYAERLNKLSEIEVKEAEDGDTVNRGLALIAPGNYHLLLERDGGHYLTRIKDGPPVSRHRPSVDVLFRSVAKVAGENALGIIMTGMGDDGAAGMMEMHKSGAKTVAQDEETCVVFGMPREAIKRGGVDDVIPLQKIPERIAQSWYY